MGLQVVRSTLIRLEANRGIFLTWSIKQGMLQRGKGANCATDIKTDKTNVKEMSILCKFRLFETDKLTHRSIFFMRLSRLCKTSAYRNRYA